MEQFKKYLISLDSDLCIRSAEESFLSYVGREKVAKLDELVPPQDLIQLRNTMFAINPGAIGLSCFRIRTAEGRLNWIAANVEKQEGEEEIIIMELSDIQSMKTDRALAQFDDMTGLLNKQAITDYAMKLTLQYPRKKFYFALMDIDHFKNVNDTLGHMRGDEVIIDVAHIVKEKVGTNGRVGRIGGDEFMLVLDDVDNKPRVREVLSSVRETVEEKYRELAEGLSITVSIGAVFFPEYVSDYGELFMLTDKMLYRAKVKGRNRYIIYTPEVHGNLKGDPITTITTNTAASERGKISLIREYMDSLLRLTDTPVHVAIDRVLHTYNLDELYIFDEEMKNCTYGIKKVLKDGKEEVAEEKCLMPILLDQKTQEAFDENEALTVNVFELKHGENDELVHYLEESGRRFMLVYHMKQAKKGGYIAYLTYKDSACRLSESDVADLIYFGRMMELTRLER